MFRWTPYTFVRTAAFFIAGILLEVYNPGIVPIQVAIAAIVSLFLVYVGLYFFSPRFPRSTFGAIGLPIVFLAGYLHIHFQKHTSQKDHLTAFKGTIEFYRAVITKYSDEKASTWKTEGMLTEVFANGQWHTVKAKLLFYFSKDDFNEPFRYGEVLLIKGSPTVMYSPANPGEFDYKRYLSFRNIFHQHFIRAGEVQVIAHDPPSLFIEYAYRSRAWCDAALRKYVTGAREQAVASALVLGVTDGLDNELLNAYASTGAMHVLAVSGLHISIIYMIIMWLLKPLLKLRSGPWFLAFISLVLLWLYAFITGLSPSVLRAVTMFSFVAVARPMGHTTNIYNTLGASVFCLLLFDPYLIMSVGFQLSYLAVVGIVYLQAPLYNLWNPKNLILDEVWKITCVSIAAQVSTFSLGLLYFHQFPNYFLLSNLLVIPGSFVVLVLGIVVLAVSVIPSLAAIFGFLLTWSIKFINYTVFAVEALPFSLIENIYITTFQSWLIMLAIIMVALMFQFRKIRYFYLACCFAIGYSIVQWHHHFQAFQNDKLTVYNVQGHSSFELFSMGKAWSFTDSALFNNKDRTRFHLHPNRLFARISNVTPGELCEDLARRIPGGRVISFNNVTVVQLHEKGAIIPTDLPFDFLIVSRNALDIPQIKKANSSRTTIILDSSNSYFYTAGFLKAARENGLRVYSVRSQGAFESNLIGNIEDG